VTMLLNALKSSSLIIAAARGVRATPSTQAAADAKAAQFARQFARTAKIKAKQARKLSRMAKRSAKKAERQSEESAHTLNTALEELVKLKKRIKKRHQKNGSAGEGERFEQIRKISSKPKSAQGKKRPAHKRTVSTSKQRAKMPMESVGRFHQSPKPTTKKTNAVRAGFKGASGGLITKVASVTPAGSQPITADVHKGSDQSQTSASEIASHSTSNETA